VTSREISLIQNSFRQINPIADHAGVIFFARLFELDPTLRTTFQGDIGAQGSNLMQSVGFIVYSLDQIEVVLPVLRQMGLRQSEYHLSDEQYEVFCEALLWTLTKCLRETFTVETRDAWAKTFWLLAETIKAGTRDGLARQKRAVA
jgi:hemoglobin-like flavoprotein